MSEAQTTSLPLVGISGERGVHDTGAGGRREVDSSPIGYQHAIAAAGGLPVILPVISPEQADAIVARLDALVLQGGEDVTPALYGGAEQPEFEHSELRDSVEIALIRAARARKIPVLAICRGIQILNVATGGTLVQDLPTTETHPRPATPEERAAIRHDVAVTPGTRLAEIIGTSATVNTFHHQSVDQTGEMVVTATAPDGVVEAGEIPEPAAEGWWNLAVQWHPERLATFEDDPPSRAIFAALIAAAKAH